MVAVDKRGVATLLNQEPSQYMTAGKPTATLRSMAIHTRTVNHSQEFVNEEGDSSNKIEGHWRQAKVKLPPFGVTESITSPLT